MTHRTEVIRTTCLVGLTFTSFWSKIILDGTEFLVALFFCSFEIWRGLHKKERYSLCFVYVYSYFNNSIFGWILYKNVCLPLLFFSIFGSTERLCRSVLTDVQGLSVILPTTEALLAFCSKSYWGQHFSEWVGVGVIRQFQNAPPNRLTYVLCYPQCLGAAIRMYSTNQTCKNTLRFILGNYYNFCLSSNDKHDFFV